jgi:hypothetical protein
VVTVGPFEKVLHHLLDESIDEQMEGWGSGGKRYPGRDPDQPLRSLPPEPAEFEDEFESNPALDEPETEPTPDKLPKRFALDPGYVGVGSSKNAQMIATAFQINHVGYKYEYSHGMHTFYYSPKDYGKISRLMKLLNVDLYEEEPWKD